MEPGSSMSLQPTGGLPASLALWGAGSGAGLSRAEAVKNAFEALLLAQLMKPMEQGLQTSGLFPKGAPGEIYAHLWQVQVSELIAEGLDVLPGWDPAPAAVEGLSHADGSATPTAQIESNSEWVRARAAYQATPALRPGIDRPGMIALAPSAESAPPPEESP